uniref:Transmembrane protein 154 n=1 Tax=Sphenodon punctatus TaxID=8508 RepID=A0A8D0HGA8_SPHPU
MPKENFLSFLLFITAGSACYGSTVAGDESSGDEFITTATHNPDVSTTFFTTDDHDLSPVFTPTEIENATSTESIDVIDRETAEVPPALMFGVPVVLLVLLILLIILFVKCRKRKQSKQDELESENGKSAATTEASGVLPGISLSPIFEEDTPSVMEIEMEELDKWMNSMNKNAEHEGLSTVKEEPNNNPSDCKL